jgi:predicted RNA methylase
MTLISASAAASAAAPLPLGSNPEPAGAIFTAAGLLLPHLERGERVDAAALRAAMETAFGASDATGAWDWKTAYDACEAATVLFLRKYGRALFRKAGSPAARLSALSKIANLLPTHTRRSTESQTFQQFSTPIPLGLVAACAAAITPADRVLEPSAGTGLFAILAEIAGGALVLNELADTRASLLSLLFPAIPVARFDAAQIDDHLDPAVTPSVVLMNPPFSAMANVEGRIADTTYRHVASALARLTRRKTGDDHRRQFRVRQSGLAGRLHSPAGARAHRLLRRHRRRGLCQTRHDVSDAADRHRQAARRRSGRVPAAPGVASNAATLLGWLDDHLPTRLAVDPSLTVPAVAAYVPRSVRGYINRTAKAVPAAVPMAEPEGLPLSYETQDGLAGEDGRLSDGIYEEYLLQAIRIAGSQAHPTRLVQSAAMASVAPPRPSYRPHLPVNIHELLSDAQLETVIYAGEAHADHLAGSWTVDATFDVVTAAREDATNAARFRRGFMIGDGTGVGKGRQSAAIILDNWLQGC